MKIRAEEFARRYVNGLKGVLDALPFEALGHVIELLEMARRDRRQVFVAGNGGSAATASHMANDLLKGVCKGGGKPFRVRALSDGMSVLTAIANDEGYERIFSSQLEALAEAGDVLIVISGSGNSPNVLEAIRAARANDMRTIGFLGMGGGTAASLVDVAVVVPSADYGPVEDVHMIFDHLITSFFQRASGV